MKSKLLLMLIMLIGSCKFARESQVLIYQGEETDLYPFVNRLEMQEWDSETQKSETVGFCTLEFLSDSAAITAKHCVEPLRSKLISLNEEALFFIPHPKEDVTLVVFPKGTYTGAWLPSFREDLLDDSAELIIVGYGNNDYTDSECYVVRHENRHYDTCELYVKDRMFTYKARVCDSASAENEYRILVTKYPEIETLCRSSSNKVLIYDDKWRETGHGKRRMAKVNDAYHNESGGIVYLRRRSDTHAKYHMSGDSGGAVLFHSGEEVKLVGVIVSSILKGFHISKGLNKKSGILAWIKEQARYDLVDIPALNIEPSVAGLPPDAVKLGEK